MKKYTEFTVRKSKPTSSDKFVKCYIRKDAGWSWAVIGSPTDSECNVLSNCVGYAQGRFCEIYNEIKNTTGNKYRYLNCNAENFVERAKESYPELKMGSEPKPGAIICWQKGTLSSKDGAGHVAVVEQVIDDETILTSESGWGSSKPFWNQTRKKGDGNWGYGTFRCFIYNPAVEEWEEPTYDFKIGDHIILNGPLYKSSVATEASGWATNKDTYITRYYKKGTHPYNTTNDLGWCDASSMTLVVEVPHKITVKQCEHGNIKVSVGEAVAGTKIKVEGVADEGYVVGNIYYNDIKIENNEFVMPDKDVIISGEFKRITYKVICEECENGSISVDKELARQDETVTISYKHDDGYILELITSEQVEIDDNNKFVMPNNDVVLKATFAKESSYSKLIKVILNFIKEVIELIFNKK